MATENTDSVPVNSLIISPHYQCSWDPSRLSERNHGNKTDALDHVNG